MRLTDLIPIVRRQRERIDELEHDLAVLRKDQRLRLRSHDELLNAYGILSGTLKVRPDSIRIEPDAVSDLQAIKDALCWVLLHDHPTMTADYLEALKEHCRVEIIKAEDIDISTLTNIINGAGNDRTEGRSNS